MKTLIAFGVLLLAVSLGGFKLFNRVKTAPPFSYLFYSGSLFILFGYLAGQNGFNLISPEILHDLAPILHFSLAWAGFITGFQLEIKFLRRIPLFWYVSVSVVYIAAFVGIFYSSYLAASVFFPGVLHSQTLRLSFSLVLSFLTAGGSVSFIAWSSRFFHHRPEHIRFCLFAASMDNILPVVASGSFLSLFFCLPGSQTLYIAPVSHGLLLFGLQILSGAAAGFALFLLIRKTESRYEISAVLFGAVFLSAGIARIFGNSSLFIVMIAGAVFSNLTRRHDAILKILSAAEKPVYLVLLVILAMQKTILSWALPAVALLILLSKQLFRAGALKLLSVPPRMRDVAPPFYAYLLLPVSNIAPAVLLDVLLSRPHPIMPVLTGVLLATLMISEVLAPSFIRLTQQYSGKKTKNEES